MTALRRIALAAFLALVLSACGNEGETDDTQRDAETGEITESGQLGAFVLSVGDCLRGNTVGEVSGFEGVPCAEEHESEVYHLFNSTSVVFPGEEALTELAGETCLAEFTDYVGIEYAASMTYDISWLIPTEDSWELGDDREIVCLLTPFEADTLVGSGKGAAT